MRSIQVGSFQFGSDPTRLNRTIDVYYSTTSEVAITFVAKDSLERKGFQLTYTKGMKPSLLQFFEINFLNNIKL